MKWFFILLLLANVLYFGWEIDRQTRFDISLNSPIAELPNEAIALKFLAELEEKPPLRVSKPENIKNTVVDSSDEVSIGLELADDEEPADDKPDVDLNAQLMDFSAIENNVMPVSASCFSFGPVADESQANTLHDWFDTRGAQATMRHKDEQGRRLFWVYLAPQDSRQEAIATIKNIQAKGVEDVRVIARGNLQNAISMGLFSSQAAVNKRLSELKKKGLKPVVVPYSDEKRVYWIDAKLPEDERMLESVFSDYPARFTSIPVKCTEIAIESDYS